MTKAPHSTAERGDNVVPLRLNAPTAPPTQFLPWDPNNQVVWDASSLRTFQECAAKYNYRHLMGWMTPEASMDLAFGHALGTGLEAFYREVIENGVDHDTALRRAIRVALQETWDGVANLPRMGAYKRVWRCNGLAKYKNEKGNAAKCPFSHKGKLFPAPGPSPCVCGSTTATFWQWLPFNRTKDRVQLIRALVWYCEEQKEGQLRPISIGNEQGHTAAVELPFLVPFTSINGVQYWLCGWWDAVKQAGGTDGPAYVTDYKTTRHTLSSDYWAGWQPNTQVDLYDMVAAKFAPIPVEGVAIEGIQVGCDRNGEGWVRFGYRAYHRTAEQRQEFAREVSTYLGMAATYAQVGYWPMNRSACKLCEFKSVCNMPEAQRPSHLAEHFIRAKWNPMLRKVEHAVDSGMGGGLSGGGGDVRSMPSPQEKRGHEEYSLVTDISATSEQGTIRPISGNSRRIGEWPVSAERQESRSDIRLDKECGSNRDNENAISIHVQSAERTNSDLPTSENSRTMTRKVEHFNDGDGTTTDQGVATTLRSLQPANDIRSGDGKADGRPEDNRSNPSEPDGAGHRGQELAQSGGEPGAGLTCDTTPHCAPTLQVVQPQNQDGATR